jgi:hypothetical protein
MFIVRFQDYWEVLVLYDAKHWKLPSEIPAKYLSRVLKRDQTELFVWVHSIRHTDPYYASSSTFKDGLWICKDDFTARGGVPPSVFGCPISAKNPCDHSILEQWSPTLCHIRVAYHGTSREAFHSIATHGFNNTFGMLGTGIYVGSFWKACRFAARDQQYQEREQPIVIRLLWKCREEDILKFPRSFEDGFCLCSKCYGNPEQKAFCAHTYDWSANSSFPPPKPFYRGSWKAGQLLPTKYPSGKWATQNEEWVLNASLIQGIAQAVQLDRSSIARPHYDPLQRNITFV